MGEITRDWLRDAGFKWHDVPRGSRHWLLWVGGVSDRKYGVGDPDSLGIEVAEPLTMDEGRWMLFVRADYAGRYSRFLFIRDVTCTEQIVALAEAMTGKSWNPEHHLYGTMRSAEAAEQLKAESERLDKRLAESQGRAIEHQRGYPHADDPSHDPRREAIERE